MSLVLRPGAARLDDLRRVWRGASVRLDPDCATAVEAGAATVDRLVASGRSVYGVNTGFGLLAQTRIPDDKLAQLQRNLVLSHACGVGEPLDDSVVRLVLATKILSLARGFSGVRRGVIERLEEALNAGVLPLIPSQGSVGASGDLAPLAHMTAAFMGYGHFRRSGRVEPATETLSALDWAPLELGPKEGLALLNGTQVSTALALDALFRAQDGLDAAVVAAAMSLEALKGSHAPLDPRIHAARGQPGQIAVAARLRALLVDSAIHRSHADCGKVQDPYSFRCAPQVLGACLEALAVAGRTLEIEANAATDNPLIFAETAEAISGGNFHAEPVAFAADHIAIAAAEVASLSERRLAILVDPKMSGLPAFLVDDSGLNSGFMLAQVTAAALVSENKTLAHPAVVDSLPTSADQEDHVSMATWAGRKAAQVARNSAKVVAVELLAAAQGLDFHAPLKTSAPLEAARAIVRAAVPPYDADRYFAPDIEAATILVETGSIGRLSFV